MVAVAVKPRVAALVRRFPSLSQTFVLSQITGLVDRGCDVEIFADDPDSPGVREARADLLARTTHYGIPDNYAVRLTSAARHWLRAFDGYRHVRRRALDLRRHGMEAASLRLLFEARAIVGRRPYDVVHAHFGPRGVLAARLRDIGAFHAPIVTTFYGYDVSGNNPLAGYDLLFREGDRFLAISERMRDRLVRWGCDPQRISIHRLGVDLCRFSPTRHARRAARAPLRIVSIARLVPKKGIEHGVRAIAALVRRRQDIDVRYTVIGDGPLRGSIERLIAELRLGDVVHVAGWRAQSEMREVLSDADILLAPSVTAPNGDAEGTPMAILEAQAMEVPIVSTRHEGIPEIVADGESGLLVREGDAAALADAIAQLALDATLRQRMGAAGRSIVSERHDIVRLNDALLDIYEEMQRSR